MKTRSAKNKGKRLQNDVRDLILETFTELEPDDVRQTNGLKQLMVNMVVKQKEIRINMFLMKWKPRNGLKKNIVSFGKINSNWYNFPFRSTYLQIYI